MIQGQRPLLRLWHVNLCVRFEWDAEVRDTQIQEGFTPTPTILPNALPREVLQQEYGLLGTS